MSGKGIRIVLLCCLALALAWMWGVRNASIADSVTSEFSLADSNEVTSELPVVDADTVTAEPSSTDSNEVTSELPAADVDAMTAESSLTDADAGKIAPLTIAETVLASMDVREKVFQMFMVFPDQLTGEKTVTAAGNDMREALHRYPVGGVIFDATNMKKQVQVRQLLDDMQAYSVIPLLMSCDEEGGRVSRLMKTVGTPYVGAMLSYRNQGAGTAKANAMTLAGGLASCGFNMNLAPVADVWSNPDNTVIGNRAYSTDFQEAAVLIRAAVEGFHEGGIICTLKHFPGHGDTYEDSHTGSARVYRTLQQLEEAEFLPFRAGIEAGADAVMIGHLIAGEIDPVPATFSRVIVTDLLKEKLGFTGVIITDSLQMEAVTEHYSPAEAAVFAVEAGVDMLLCPDNLHAAAEALLSAVEEGRLSESRLDESVLKILRLKETYGLFQ